MAESKGIKEIANQVVVQAATAVMMAFRDADIDPNHPQQQARGSHRDKVTVDPYLKSPHSIGILRIGPLIY